MLSRDFSGDQITIFWYRIKFCKHRRLFFER